MGMVLGMLDCQEGSGFGYCEMWFRFRLMRRYRAFRPEELGRISRLMDLLGAGALGHGLVLVRSASDIGFRWSSQDLEWFRPGLPCCRKGLGSGPFLGYMGSMQLLNSSHVRDRDRAMLRGVLSGRCLEWFSSLERSERTRFLSFLWEC